VASRARSVSIDFAKDSYDPDDAALAGPTNQLEHGGGVLLERLLGSGGDG
jgi:hypothetical protein